MTHKKTYYNQDHFNDDLVTGFQTLFSNLRSEYDMGRRRIHDRGLPTRVVKRHGAFYYIHPQGRWIRLADADDIAGMYRALADAITAPDAGMSALLDRYKADVLKNKAPRTRKDQEAQIEMLRSTFGERSPKDIKPPDIAAYLDTAEHKVAANRHITLLSDVFTAGIRWGKCTTNPCRGVRRNKENPRKVYVDDSTFWGVWNAAPQHIGLAMELALITGQRLADVLGLPWSAVQKDGLLFVQNKTQNAVLIERNPWLDDVLNRCKESSNTSTHVLVNSRGRPWTTDGFKTAWQRFIRTQPNRFQFRDIRKKSGNDAETGDHLGNDRKTFEKWYRLKPKKAKGLDRK